jgi:tryptophan synthase alpha chain
MKVSALPENRLSRRFATLADQQRKALIPYVMVGDPSLEVMPELLTTLVAAGADVLELGMPFSDPIADGPVIQAAGERALAKGANLAAVLATVAKFRETDQETPIILMGYLNPIEFYGYEAFAAAAAKAGVDGILAVDVPPEEADALKAVLNAQHIAFIYLLAPTSTPARMAKVAAAANGFLYYVSLKGVTGAAVSDLTLVQQQIAAIRAVTQLPVGVGFGVKDADTAKALAPFADALIVGSKLIETMLPHHADLPRLFLEVTGFLGSLRQAIDSVCEVRDGR